MEVTHLAALQIQRAWRAWHRSSPSRFARSQDNDQQEELAHATSGYISASSSSSRSRNSSSSADATGTTTFARTRGGPPAPRRSWTALPLNLHRLGDSSGDTSPFEEPQPLSVGASRSDLSCPEWRHQQQQQGACCWLEGRRDALGTKTRRLRLMPGLLAGSDPATGSKDDAAMELCFRNDAASDDEELSAHSPELNERNEIASAAAAATASAAGSRAGEWQRFCRPAMLKDSQGSQSQQISGKSATRSLTRRPLEPELLESLGIDCNREIMSVHSRLRGEAWMAFAQVEPMTQMQLRIDSNCKDLRPSCDSEQHYCLDKFKHIGSNKDWSLPASELHAARPAALKAFRDCLLRRIEGCNGQLVNCLVERDDLHMEQDSLLTEIEDLTRRAQEAARRLRLKEFPVEFQGIIANE